MLVASEGLPRIEFFRDEKLIDTMHVHKFSADGLTDLFVELGQKRDSSRTWERLRAEAELAKAFVPKP